MPHKPLLVDPSQHLILVQQLWRELQATVRDPQKSNELERRIRRQADLYLRRGYLHKAES